MPQNSLNLSIACGHFDRTEALFDGSVSIEGCVPRMFHLSPEEAFFRAFGNAEFDVAELSFSSYLIEHARNNAEYVALPVFLGRSFRHNGIYIRTDRGIEKPEDLKGKRVGVPEYQVTAAVWIRGLLADQYGVQASDIQWLTGGVEQAGRKEKLSLNLPDNLTINAIGGENTLSQMLRDGEIDALIAPRVPSCFQQNAPHIERLFPNYWEDEADYYRQTRIFPIMHILGVRKALLKDNPWLAASLYKAFTQAKLKAEPRLQDTTAPMVMLPWLKREVERTQRIMGEDYWPYGVEANRAELEAITRYSYEQGLVSRRLSVEEIFAPGTHSSPKV